MPSSVVAAIHYDIGKMILTVVYTSGSVYHYFDVPADIYTAMKKAHSKGTYLNDHIKGHYAFEKVE